LQVVQDLVRRIPDGHQVKREVDFILNQISDTMTPMHYHIREVIFVTLNKVRSRRLRTRHLYYSHVTPVRYTDCFLLPINLEVQVKQAVWYVCVSVYVSGQYF